jgi:hypothetical protein
MRDLYKLFYSMCFDSNNKQINKQINSSLFIIEKCNMGK